MFNKFLFYIISFISIVTFTFSYELTMTINNKDGFTLSDVYVTVDNEVKKTDVNGYVSFDTKQAIVSISIEKYPYKTQNLVVNLQSENKLTISLQEDYDFYINLYEGTNFSYGLSNSDFPNPVIKEAIINIYKNNELLYTLDYFGKELGFDLKKGEYSVEVYTLFSEPLYIKNVKFDPKKSKILNIVFPINFNEVKGIIKSSNTLLGDVTVNFTNENKNYKTYTDIEGSYSISLPSSYYTVTYEKNSYEKVTNKLKIDGSIKLPDIELKEIPSFIKGRLTDIDGNPLGEKKITIKNNNSEFEIFTDTDGYYEAKVFQGLSVIKVDISGFFPTGRVEQINNLSTKKIADIKLKERLSSIYGTITNGIIPMANVAVKLYDIDETYIGLSKSDSKGFFTFEKVRSGVPYYLSIDDPNFIPYKSIVFSNSDNENKNFTIILDNHSVNFILELKSKKTTNFSNLAVYINGIKFQPDINGIINETLTSIKEVYSLKVEIPKLGIEKKYILEELGQEPYLLTIDF